MIRSFVIRRFLTCALVLVAVITARSAYANDDYEADDSESDSSVAAESAQEDDTDDQADAGDDSAVATTTGAVSRQPAAIASSAAVIPDFENFLESQSQEQPSDALGQIQVRTAANFGARTDSEPYSRSELEHGPAMGMNYDTVAAMKHDSGFMRRGMDQYFGERVVANQHVLNLFQNHAHLRSESGVELPSAFAPLISFVEQYIRANALRDSESNNGFTHHTLAIQVVRASFCFGNDPFMILAKMRRETNFSRRSVSPTGAVGFSQMTGIGVKEVQHQLSGDERISLPAARTEFQKSVKCFSGLSNFEVQRGSTESLKQRISEKWGFDMVFGQILVKTLVSNAKSSQAYGNNTGGVVAAYEDAFTVYNGDTQRTRGICTGKASVEMREEYACDVISQFNRMNAQWNRFVLRSTGKDLT